MAIIPLDGPELTFVGGAGALAKHLGTPLRLALLRQAVNRHEQKAARLEVALAHAHADASEARMRLALACSETRTAAAPAPRPALRLVRP